MRQLNFVYNVDRLCEICSDKSLIKVATAAAQRLRLNSVAFLPEAYQNCCLVLFIFMDQKSSVIFWVQNRQQDWWVEARGSWFIYFYFGHFLLRRRRRTFVYNAHIISPELVYKCVSTKLEAKGAQKTNPSSTPWKQKNNNDLRTKTMTANPFNSLTSFAYMRDNQFSICFFRTKIPPYSIFHIVFFMSS